MNCRDGEMADALALGASAARHGGSSPLPGILNDCGRFYLINYIKLNNILILNQFSCLLLL